MRHHRSTDPSSRRPASPWTVSVSKLDVPAEEIQVRINSKIMSIKRRAGGYRNFKIDPMGNVFLQSLFLFSGSHSTVCY